MKTMIEKTILLEASCLKEADINDVEVAKEILKANKEAFEISMRERANYAVKRYSRRNKKEAGVRIREEILKELVEIQKILEKK